jgi:hypothetical protein
MKLISTAAVALALLLSAPAFAAETPAKTLSPQQQRMKDCNTQAKGKKGEERRSFMSTCLKGSKAQASAQADAAQPAADGAKANAPARKKSNRSSTAAH